jgi:hypothetical protein
MHTQFLSKILKGMNFLGKMNLAEMRYKDVEYIELIHDRAK